MQAQTNCLISSAVAVFWKTTTKLLFGMKKKWTDYLPLSLTKCNWACWLSSCTIVPQKLVSSPSPFSRRGFVALAIRSPGLVKSDRLSSLIIQMQYMYMSSSAKDAQVALALQTEIWLAIITVCPSIGRTLKSWDQVHRAWHSTRAEILIGLGQHSHQGIIWQKQKRLSRLISCT